MSPLRGKLDDFLKVFNNFVLKVETNLIIVHVKVVFIKSTFYDQSEECQQNECRCRHFIHWPQISRACLSESDFLSKICYPWLTSLKIWPFWNLTHICTLEIFRSYRIWIINSRPNISLPDSMDKFICLWVWKKV